MAGMQREALRPGTSFSLPGLLETCMLGFYVSLVYKLDKLGILILMALCAAAIYVRLDRKFLFSPLALLSTAYVGMATVTAFLVSTHEGAYRTIQFVIITLATATMAVHFAMMSSERTAAFMRKFALLNAIIFVHLILYHFAIGRYTTWKYLYDTKSVLSVSVLILFYYEDGIKRRFGFAGFYVCIAGLALLILMSGERKAYILFAIVFLLSKTPMMMKFWLICVTVIAVGLFAAVAPPGSYVARQLDSLITPKPKMQISEYYNIDDIGDQSDIIRSFVNMNAREQFRSHPFLGLGATGYQEFAHDNFGLATDSRGLDMNVHGEVNRVPAEEGVVGIIVSLSFLAVLAITVLLNFLSQAHSDPSSKNRLPLYTLAFLLIYASVEALDTFMLELLLLFGYSVAAQRSKILSLRQMSTRSLAFGR